MEVLKDRQFVDCRLTLCSSGSKLDNWESNDIINIFAIGFINDCFEFTFLQSFFMHSFFLSLSIVQSLVKM